MLEELRDKARTKEEIVKRRETSVEDG